MFVQLFVVILLIECIVMKKILFVVRFWFVYKFEGQYYFVTPCERIIEKCSWVDCDKRLLMPSVNRREGPKNPYGFRYADLFLEFKDINIIILIRDRVDDKRRCYVVVHPKRSVVVLAMFTLHYFSCMIHTLTCFCGMCLWVEKCFITHSIKIHPFPTIFTSVYDHLKRIK